MKNLEGISEVKKMNKQLNKELQKIYSDTGAPLVNQVNTMLDPQLP